MIREEVRRQTIKSLKLNEVSVLLPPQRSNSLEWYANYWNNIPKPSETRLLQTRMGREVWNLREALDL